MNKIKRVVVFLLMFFVLGLVLSGCVVTVTGALPSNITTYGWTSTWDAVYNGSADILADYFYLKNESSTDIYHLKIFVGDNEPTSWSDVTEDQLVSSLSKGDTPIRWDIANDWNASGLDTIWFRASALADTKYIEGSFVYEDSYGWRLTVKD